MTNYSPRKVKISEENIERMNELKSKTGRTQQWVMNTAIAYFLDREWDNLIYE